MPGSLEGRRILVTGIADEHSLALPIANALKEEGAALECAGLGRTRHHADLSDAATRYLDDSAQSFQATVAKALGSETPTHLVDLSQDGSVRDFAEALASAGTKLDGVLHAVAMDRTLRRGQAKALLEVTRDEFLDCMGISAYSLIALLRSLTENSALNSGASVVSLSYLGAERVMSHAYRNIGVAKAALERITRELAMELGRSHGVRVNAVRFSPFAASRAGGAIPDLVAAREHAQEAAPLGNASPRALALEVAHLMREGIEITGEIRHVDGGYQTVG